MNVQDYLLSADRETPERVALEYRDQKITYGDLSAEAIAVGAALRRHGLASGQTVGIMLPNTPTFVSALFGVFLNGNVLVPYNVLLTAPEIHYLCDDSGIRLLFVDESYLPRVVAGIRNLAHPPTLVVIGDASHGHELYSDFLVAAEDFEPAPIGPDSPIMMLYTSGTTGKPKAAVIADKNLAANLKMIDGIFVPDESDKTLVVLPLFHCFALNGVLIPTLKNRSTLVLHPRFEADPVVESLAHGGVTTFFGVPTMYFYILKVRNIDEVRFPHLKRCFSGGAPMPVEVMKEFESRFGVPIYEGYGLTETTVSVCMNRPGRPRKPASIGVPFDGVSMKIVDENDVELPDGEAGELVIKSPNVMLGYHNNPEATAEAIRDGWFHTGDIAYRDGDGYFFIVDRKKDVIIKGGYNIYPREIEEVIYGRPEVAEAAVIGAYDEAKGECVRAIVALKPGRNLDETTLRACVESALAKYKHPRFYHFVSELPKGPTGKILKREIREHWDQWNKDRV